MTAAACSSRDIKQRSDRPAPIQQNRSLTATEVGRRCRTVGQRILIVDDERDLVAGLVRVLAPRGYACLSAHSGQQGIELIDRERPDLVLTDLYLPDMDGLSVLRHARAQVPPIPGILITAHASASNVIRGYDAGATLYLTKPFANAALVEAIERILTRS